jgi:hypothetical protein
VQRLSLLPVIVPLTFIFISCVPGQTVIETTPPPSHQQLALDTLLEFLTDLHAGRYSEAAGLYAGSYETLIYMNPSVDPQNREALLRNACTINGVQCLQVRTAVLDSQTSANEYQFKVEFQTKDGSLFVLGPCCGASETEQPPLSVFHLRVIKNSEGRFQVMDMPPYTP